jgi:hypothetical protein
VKYIIYIKSNKKYELTPSSELYESTFSVEAEDRCEAVGIAMKETGFDKIDSKYLPLSITISEEES